MKTLFNFLGQLSWETYLKFALIFLVGSIILHILGRIFFRKRSLINHATSSAFCIIFIYTVIIPTSCLFSQENLLLHLPLISFNSDLLQFFSFRSSDFLQICGAIFTLFILAFCVNLADSILPKGKNLIAWFSLRFASVTLGYLAYYICICVLAIFLPENIIRYVPAILLSILLLLLFTGMLKIPIGAFLSTVNPIIGALYTFFIANIVGRQITRAIITTALICVLVLLLQYWGIYSLPLDHTTWLVLFPAAGFSAVLWYVAYKIL